MKPFGSTGFLSQTSADGTSCRASPLRGQRHMIVRKVVEAACEEVSGQSGFTATAGSRYCPTLAVARNRCAMDDRKPFDARMDVLKNGLIYCSDELTCVTRPQALDTIHHQRDVVLSSLSDFNAYVWNRVRRLEMFEENRDEVDQIDRFDCKRKDRPATSRFEPAPPIVGLISCSSR